MHKFIFILISICFLTAAKAEKKQVLQQDTVEQNDNYDVESPVVVEEEPYQDDYISKNFETQQKVVDTGLSFVQHIVPADSISALKKLKAFAYVNYLDSLLNAEQNKERKQRDNKPSFFDIIISSAIFKIFLWTVAIAFVLFLLYHLFLADGVFSRSYKKSKIKHDVLNEELPKNGSDFDVLIMQALKSSNYRLAIRYQYLKSLYKLSDAGMVQIAADKTNYQYVREISNYQYQSLFSKLTLHYEYVWYGEFDIDEKIYRQLETDFIQFNKNFS